MDNRWNKLGSLLVNYSTRVKPGERVMIAFGELESYPLVSAVYEACIRAGGYPQVQFLSDEFNRQLLVHGSPDQIDWIPEIEVQGMNWADVYLGLRGASDPDIFKGIDAGRLSSLRKAMGAISTLRWQKTRWCLVRVPNSSLARQANLDESSLLDAFFAACLMDYPQSKVKWQQIAKTLEKGMRVRVVGQGTDLSFSIAGRSWLAADGQINMPDGEIATSPDENTVDGQISFEMPAVLGGRQMEKLCLRWEKGMLLAAQAATNQDYLQAILQTDPGAGRIGEFAFGVNPGLTFFSHDILLDEKVNGTIHIALGRAYPNTGGTNQSAIHWDIVKDMRQQGEVYLDDQLVYQNGQFLLD